MNILKKLTLEGIKKNKKRTIGTIMGIIMSVALICAVAGMFTSFQATLIENTINDNGYYHLELDNINAQKLEEIKLNKDIKKITQINELGYSEFNHDIEEDEFPYIRVFSTTKEDFEYLKYNIVEGRYPKNSNEIILSERVLKKSNYKIGDDIELNIGELTTKDGELSQSTRYITSPIYKRYTIVGTVEKNGKDHIFYGLTTDTPSNRLQAFLTLIKPKDYKKSIANLFNVNSYEDISSDDFKLDYEYELNNELLRWETLKFNESTTTMIIAVLSIVIGIIVITSIFCIRNSFAISVVEKMKMYGMLASIGATKKQIKKSVIYEGTLLGFTGIPIGILCGLLADYILIKIINMLIVPTMSPNFNGVIFKITFLPILISIILGFVTIYLSSLSSAIKASKVSPIENLKNTKEIRMSRKKLKTPLWISSIFKTGGVLAYKNLKRSKKKYRTTVISLTVSIFVFITMNSFINETFNQSGLYYVDFDYNIIIRNLANDDEEDVSQIKQLDKIENMYVVYNYKNYYLQVTDEKNIIKYEDEGRDFAEDENGKIFVAPSLIAFDDETFKSYTDKLGISYEECKDKAILYDTFFYDSLNDSNTKYKRRYKYQKGNTITGTNELDKLSFTIGAITSESPYGYENSYYDDGIIIINKEYFKNLEFELNSVLIETNNAKELEEDINSINKDLMIFNYEEEAKAQKAYVLIISIFLYGFITVISLIGVTNIFNTITANMELRSREFAILKSIGMTKKEFNRMINLETLFYSTKALVYGIILGLLGTFALHKAFGLKNELTINIPYTAIIISIIFVFIIVSIIMKYSIRKINKQNTIETIRNENI